MARIVVTGGSGHTGWPVVQHLQAAGHEVTVVDRVPPPGSAPYKLVNLEDQGQVFGALAGADTVVHLAAIPRPLYHTPDVVYRTNLLAMVNVLEAMAALGIGRLVYGSSVSVLGFPFFEQPLSPAYVPVDEAHPRLPQDAYGLTKLLGEELIDGLVRRGKLTAVSLRMPWIHTPESFRRDIVPLQDDAGSASAAANLWSYIDTRDVAEACRLALEAPISGHEACFIAAPDTFMAAPTRELLRLHYPHAEIRAPLEGRAGILSSAKAGRVLGFEAKNSWESYAG
ncbi:MAG: NAD(P)-dependent oxidoreductase [Anaerolineae bacterium]|nr:NAD(P)-dependent oxidoreductase [Anaerolineae bacterium]